jgi:AraC family transcriptional regulator
MSTVRRTCIWNRWLPESGYQVAEVPELERTEFDPRSGNGGFEIWIPVKKK